MRLNNSNGFSEIGKWFKKLAEDENGNANDNAAKQMKCLVWGYVI